ncbi:MULTISPECIES: hypothetical protein [Staphylococcus]|uniref:Uncharacterized protein n=1 Tax=Staphylococcus shinii TaxID=2912228 RepID=A0A418IGJ3_9STAP|nr:MULTISPECIES: hypothetical protein [Staphylococcus]RIN01600.1 hypothetical protein BU112_05125 [Staphylococcus shinii]
MISIISAIGSLGTFIMAIFYFVSVSIQLYQMKISFIPALGFNQTLLELNSDNELIMNNTKTDNTKHEDYLKLYNLGGGAARKIKIEVILNEDKTIQEKFINMLPSSESYYLPVNKEVFDEFESTIQNNGYETNLNIKLTYYHNISRKPKEVRLNAKIDAFNTYSDKNIYELQFIEK